MTFNSFCRCPREQQSVWEVEKAEIERKEAVGWLEPLCWSHRAEESTAQSSRFTWSITAALVLFQQPDRKHLGPRAREWSRGGRRSAATLPLGPHPTQHIISSTFEGSSGLNSTPRLPLCKQTQLLCGQRRSSSLQPLSTEEERAQLVRWLPLGAAHVAAVRVAGASWAWRGHRGRGL